jgi:hypothetical protein
MVTLFGCIQVFLGYTKIGKIGVYKYSWVYIHRGGITYNGYFNNVDWFKKILRIEKIKNILLSCKLILFKISCIVNVVLSHHKKITLFLIWQYLMNYQIIFKIFDNI